MPVKADNIFAIGDIHGCFDKLAALMEKIPICFGQDKLVFLGDYIDRGPDSFNVVEYLINLKKRYRNIIFLKGNHEDMLANYLSGTGIINFLANGGQQTLESYNRHKKPDAKNLIPPEHIDFFKSLDLYYETDDYIFVHAGLKDKIPLKDQQSFDLLWIRHDFTKSQYDFGKRVVFGHTYFRKPFIQPNKIGIDTGAVYGNKLTCVKLPELVFYHV